MLILCIQTETDKPHVPISVNSNGKAYLSSNLTIQSEGSSKSSFTDGLWAVDFITQHQHWHVDYGLVPEESLNTQRSLICC